MVIPIKLTMFILKKATMSKKNNANFNVDWAPWGRVIDATGPNLLLGCGRPQAMDPLYFGPLTQNPNPSWSLLMSLYKVTRRGNGSRGQVIEVIGPIFSSGV